MGLGGGPLDEARHALALVGGDERSHFHTRIGLRSHLERANGTRKIGNEFVENLRTRIQPAGGRAILTGVIERECADTAHHGVDIGVVENDNGRLASELEVGALEIPRGGAEYFLARRDIASDRNHANGGVTDEWSANAVTPAADDVCHTFGEQLEQVFTELECGQRCLLGGLENYRVARGQRRCQLPCGHHQRIVPGRDRSDHAHWIAPDHAGKSGQILSGKCPVLSPRGAREKPEDIGDRGNLVVQGGRERLARVARLDLGQDASIAFDPVSEFQKKCSAILGRRLRPPFESRLGGPDGRLQLLAAGFGDARDLRSTRGVENTLCNALAPDQLTVDQQPRLHGSPSRSFSQQQCVSSYPDHRTAEYAPSPPH
jgi:hypothetical protein